MKEADLFQQISSILQIQNMNSLSKTIQSLADKSIITTKFLGLLFIVCLSNIHAQNNKVFTITADALQNGESVGLSKAGWKYKTGDDLNWANPQFDDSSWETLETSVVKPDLLKQPDWNGRGWFRLHFKVDESIADKYFALVASQTGASEVYLDGSSQTIVGKVFEAIDDFAQTAPQHDDITLMIIKREN